MDILLKRYYTKNGHYIINYCIYLERIWLIVYDEQAIKEKMKDKIESGKSITIMGIESSCDETSVAVVRDGHEILANVIASQIDIHRNFGGVVPEIASRKHLELINPILEEALKEAKIDWSDLDAIAVTYGPGLVGALLVGVSTAKALAYALNLPLIGVNHMEGHIYANFLEKPELSFPFLCLVVSGGHTDLVYMNEHRHYELLGRTRDDAAGEAFDKVARSLGLLYPGGPAIDAMAKQGCSESIEFPVARFKNGIYDFSFSGLKSAVLNEINHSRQKNEEIVIADIAASFQKAVVKALVEKTFLAAKDKGIKQILMAGGVAGNSELRETMTKEGEKYGISISYPRPILCTDNAAMITCVAYYQYLTGETAPLLLNAVPNLQLGEKCYEGKPREKKIKDNVLKSKK